MQSQLTKKDIVSPELIKALFTKYSTSKDLSVLRDLAMIILSFTGFLRYDELSNIRCHNVSFIENSHVKIRIEKSKTDQYRDGNDVLLSKLDSVACPFTILQSYIDVAQIDLSSSDFLFKAIFKSKYRSGLRIKSKKLSYTQTKEVLVSRLKEFASPDLKLGLHSLRSGGASAAANSNVNDRCWRRHGRWKSDAANGYIKDSIINRLSVSQHLGL